MTCSNCGADDLGGNKFCLQCGHLLAQACPSCGAPLPAGARFCGACGSPLQEVAPPVATELAGVATTGSYRPPLSELRHVSVLFCDLVGFTPLSEARDPEEVRELLSGYFELARAIVTRYGGVIQKFIGDAVMALWGAPVTQEDDAERAVRAGLDLLGAVSAYGFEHAHPGLEARVGIVTGTAATTESAEEGMVIGDRVNTAARIQSVAAPGCLYVDSSTKRATEAAIVYKDSGRHALKGKSEPFQLYEAVRVVAGVGGALKSAGLEAPFVGRERELRLVRDLFLGSAEEKRAHLVSVTGIAGIGKSRLAWEFYKYIDGLSGIFRWHRGRCLSYGEGVAYWALAEMVRGRAGILEKEDVVAAAEKLHACVEEHVADVEERRFVEPRLAHLIGIEERSARDKEDLFSAWRLFFERIADRSPVVMSFEDMQWADSSLLDFVDYLLEWSRNHAIFVLTLARPEIAERRPTWGAGRRNFNSIYLEPLSEKAMRELVTALVPGLDDDTTERILDHAEGVPLYAVETVRMLIDRALLLPDGDSYRPAGPIGALDIPDTLHALIAARLDGLAPGERAILQEAAVIGKSFSKESLAALSGLGGEALDELLTSVVRKEVISLQADPLSPDRGQYAFLQDLVRAVAYESLPKRDRKDKHLSVAAHLLDTQSSDEDEIVEVVASHYLEAYRLAPTAPDAGEVKAAAREMILRAGERAAALAAAEGAQSYFEQALELTDDEFDRAAIHERAGQMAAIASHLEEARRHFNEAIAAHEAIGESHASARLSSRLGEIDYTEGRLEEGIERMEKAFALLADEEPDADVATLAAQLGRLHVLSGKHDLAIPRIELALSLAERFRLSEQLAQALNTKAVLLEYHNRREEATVLLEHALQVALENDLSDAALRAYNNLAVFFEERDCYRDARAATTKGLELARRVGDRSIDMQFLAGEISGMVFLGEWDVALERVAEVRRLPDVPEYGRSLVLPAVQVLVEQGKLDAARELVKSVSSAEHSEDVQSRTDYMWATALLKRAAGDSAGALEALAGLAQVRSELSIGTNGVKLGLVEQIEAAVLVDPEKAEKLVSMLEQLPPGVTTPFLQAQAARLRAKLSPAAAAVGLSTAVAIFRQLSMPFWLAVSLLEDSERLLAEGGSDEGARRFAEAEELFERLHARPWLDRLESSKLIFQG